MNHSDDEMGKLFASVFACAESPLTEFALFRIFEEKKIRLVLTLSSFLCEQ